MTPLPLHRRGLLHQPHHQGSEHPLQGPSSLHRNLSGFRAALDLDTYSLSNLIRLQCADILAFSLFFTPYLQNRRVIFHALVALKLLVSLISRLVAWSVQIVVDRQTNRQTNRHRTTTCTVTLAAHARRLSSACKLQRDL